MIPYTAGNKKKDADLNKVKCFLVQVFSLNITNHTIPHLLQDGTAHFLCDP